MPHLSIRLAMRTILSHKRNGLLIVRSISDGGLLLSLTKGVYRVASVSKLGVPKGIRRLPDTHTLTRLLRGTPAAFASLTLRGGLKLSGVITAVRSMWSWPLE